MLHRPDSEGVIVISQPAHAWVSGQLARAWGNETFGHFAPREETCLAAELHDIGFFEWEQAPTLNAKTGWPHSFLELPTGLHLEVWSTGITHLQQYARYAALLVSMHFVGLAQRHPITYPRAEAELAQDFLAKQEMLQEAFLISLRADAFYAAYCREDVLARNRRLVSLWDWMSLLLCMGFGQKQVIPGVPAADANLDVTFTPLETSESSRVMVTPWPFEKQSLRLVCEGRRLSGIFTQERAMREALSIASAAKLQIDLLPGKG